LLEVNIFFRESQGKLGLEVQNILHNLLLEQAKPTWTFSKIHQTMMGVLEQQGWVNLDFKENFGHTIESSSEQRRFITGDCNLCLNDTQFFTFEPHIQEKKKDEIFESSTLFGIKKENIYYFVGDSLHCL